MNKVNLVSIVVMVLLCMAAPLWAEEGGDGEKDKTYELQKKLENPVANMISVPFQNNWDFGIGPANAMRYTLNVQPVIPFELSKDWNLITRTIVPYIYAESPVEGGDDKSGLGDITQSFLLSPVKPVNGWILAFGPILRYPTATDDALGGEKWGAGPQVLALQQNAGWTYGALVYHLWSFAGSDSRSDLNQTWLQLFLSRAFKKTHTTVGVSSESSYDWEAHEWTVPISVKVGQLIRIGKQPVKLGLSAIYYAVRPDNGPDCGIRFEVTLPFPK
ncbi:MAG: hypothetical protein M0Z67_03085 [Nitrospiraceae bacterium]|nr:hypothetical protein [Nitrospiraceae bacterium]